MITRKFKFKNCQSIKKELTKDAQYNPSDLSYISTIQINKTDYILKYQFLDDNKVLLHNAMEVNHSDNEKSDYTLITKGRVLSALFEIIYYEKFQSLKAKCKK